MPRKLTYPPSPLSFKALGDLAKSLGVHELVPEAFSVDAISPAFHEHVSDITDNDFEGMTFDDITILLDTLPISGSLERSYSDMTSWLYKLARPVHGPTWEKLEKLPPKPTRAELEAWAWNAGVSDLLDLSSYHFLMPALGTYPKRSVEHVIDASRRQLVWTVADCLSSEAMRAIKRHASALQLRSLREVIETRAEQRHAGRHAWRIIKSRHLDKDTPLPRISIQLERAIKLLQEYEDHGISPDASTSRAPSRTTFDQRELLLRYSAPQRVACEPKQGRHVAAYHFDGERSRVACPCGQPRCHVKVSAVLGALEYLVANRRDPALDIALKSSRFERTIDDLLTTFTAETGIPSAMDGSPAWFGWRVEGSVEEDFKVRPALAREKKRQKGIITKPFTDFDEIDDLFEDLDDERDRELLLRWETMELEQKRAARSYYGYGSRRARKTPPSMKILTALAGHPRVYYHTGKSVRLRITHRVGSLHFGSLDDGRITPSLAFGDNILEPHELEEIFELFAETTHVIECFDHDADGAILEIWTLPKKLLGSLEQIQALVHTPLPADAREELVAAAPRLTQHDVVQLSSDLRGEYFDPAEKLLVRLRLEETHLEVLLLAAPLANGPTYSPGRGPKVLYAMGPEGTVHTERAWAREHAAAKQLCAFLELTPNPADDTPYQWHMEIGSDEMFDVLERIECVQREERERGSERVDVVWDTRKINLGENLGSGALRLQVNATERYLELGGELSIGEGRQSVPLDQLLLATRQRRRWIQLDEETWAKITDQLEESLDRIGALLPEEDAEKPHLANISPLAAPSLMNLAEHAGVQVEGPATWLSLTQRIEEAATLEPTLPGTFVGELRGYQKEGFRWLARLAHWAPGACLADDMGLGKTIQALALLLARAEHGPALLIGPTSLGFNWKRECEKFTPSLTLTLVRSSAELAALEEPSANNLYYMSYELAARNEEWCNARTWATLVLDEAQAIKNAATQRARAIHDIESEFSLILTGTPMENHTGELWSLMQVIAPGLLGGRKAFRKTFQVPIEAHGDTQARMTLAALISPFVLRRIKRDVASDLPERTDVRLDVELSDEERALYDDLRRAAVEELASEEPSSNRRFELLAAITRLRQLACHPALYRPEVMIPSSKVNLLVEKLEEAREEGHHALVFSQFTSLLDLVEKELDARGFRTAKLTGSTSAKKRGVLVDEFQAGEHDAFLLSIKAGGVGLNLTRASFVFILDPWWNPAVEDQATDRAHRIGQDQPVMVYRLITLDTVEEVIHQMHATKRALMDAVMSGSGSSSALTVEELHAMITGDLSSLAEGL